MTTLSAIGRSLAHLDGAEKVAGLTRYAGDVTVPGRLHARLVPSPHAHARITTEAIAAPDRPETGPRRR